MFRATLFSIIELKVMVRKSRQVAGGSGFVLEVFILNDILENLKLATGWRIFSKKLTFTTKILQQAKSFKFFRGAVPEYNGE